MNRFVSLMYHNVCCRKTSSGEWDGFEHLSPSITRYFVDVQTFRDHCRILAHSRHRLQQASGGYPDVQITFDDGWRGTFDEAGPILRDHNLRAHVFVTTDLIDRPQFATARQLQAEDGVFTIGSHGRTHRLLARLADHEIQEELQTSRKTLEDLLGRPVDSVSFPGGSYDRRVLRIARHAGYRFLYSSEVQINSNPQSAGLIGRIPIRENTSVRDLKRFAEGRLQREKRRRLAASCLKCVLGYRGYAALRSRLLDEKADQLEMTDLGSTSFSNAPRL